jgi:hypothetical protein
MNIHECLYTCIYTPIVESVMEYVTEMERSMKCLHRLYQEIDLYFIKKREDKWKKTDIVGFFLPESWSDTELLLFFLVGWKIRGIKLKL